MCQLTGTQLFGTTAAYSTVPLSTTMVWESDLVIELWVSGRSPTSIQTVCQDKKLFCNNNNNNKNKIPTAFLFTRPMATRRRMDLSQHKRVPIEILITRPLLALLFLQTCIGFRSVFLMFRSITFKEVQ